MHDLCINCKYSKIVHGQNTIKIGNCTINQSGNNCITCDHPDSKTLTINCNFDTDEYTCTGFIMREDK